MIILRMASGALCHLDFSRRTAYGCDERIEVSGAEGTVESGRRGGVPEAQRAGAMWVDA